MDLSAWKSMESGELAWDFSFFNNRNNISGK